jgi:iduronate 2-sulfatase
MRARRNLTPFAALLAALAAPVMASPPPNVLFIAIDDLRPELGCYGSPLAQTPHLDGLASRGTLFERAYCQQALCAPSRASLLTGLRPDSTGIYGLTQSVRQVLPEVRTLPQHFRESGYTTVSIGKIYHHGGDDAQEGWSLPPWHPSGSWFVAADPANAALTPDGRPMAWERAEVDDDFYPDGRIARRAESELARLKEAGQPFFLAVGFLKPHLPFFAPAPFWAKYDNERLSLPEPAHWPEHMPALATTNWQELRNYRGIPAEGPLPEELGRTLVHGYLACVSYVDALVGRVLAELERQELAGNTIVVVWGDHGYKLGEYGAWAKHTNLEIDARVPLIIAAPHEGGWGGRTRALVELTDLYPTLADLCALPVPAHCEGRSLRPWLTEPDRPGPRAAYTQYPSGAERMGYSVRDDRWRYTEWRERSTGAVVARELYDHASSPVATVNLAQDARYTSERDRLAGWLAAGLVPVPEAGTAERSVPATAGP